MRRLRILLAAIGLAGCTAPPAIVEVPPTHPASASAPEAPAEPESSTLFLDAPATPPAEPAPHHHEHGTPPPKESPK
jgi:hypothetical protein